MYCMEFIASFPRCEYLDLRLVSIVIYHTLYCLHVNLSIIPTRLIVKILREPSILPFPASSHPTS